MCEEAKFCILKVVKHFENSVQSSPDDVLMDEYLEGYTELNKFFALMGKVFGFVSSDVKDKVVILQTLRNGEEKDKFVSFKEMIEYERDNNLLEKKGYTSGSRTLLRLHRGLDFIREFLRKLGDIASDEKTGQSCLDAYNSTLANFHPWLIRKGVAVSVFALPTRDNLLNKVCANVDEAIISLPETLKVMSVVYDRTQEMYTKYDLHSLP